ncbi:Cas4 family exonuclease [Streptomyces phage Mischief19]|nr:Cas4 family exonuclease [Streptomyces phage Mischief19]
MGYDAERAEELADMHAAGLINADGSDVDEFDSPDEFDTPADRPEAEVVDDPARPEAVRGRYRLPHPETGKTTSWQRVSNLVKLADDTYHLELWKLRCAAKGVALLASRKPSVIKELAALDVKADKERVNRIVEKAQDAADANKASDEGTLLHTSTELADYADGNPYAPGIPERHRAKVRLYLDALAAEGITVVPGMIERVTVSTRYEVAGKFDRLYELPDGSRVIGDLKTGDKLDLSLPGYTAQLACYEDGVNTAGVWDGSRYDKSIKVRDDYGLIVWLPSTRDEVELVLVDLAKGHEINRVNLEVRIARRTKAKHVSHPYALLRGEMVAANAAVAVAQHDYWSGQLSLAESVEGLIMVRDRCKALDHWTEALGMLARELAKDLPETEAEAIAVRADIMGS